MQYKIKNIEIFDENNKKIREIALSDYFFVIGENSKKNNKKTSNALGKTVLINLISFCLCGNNNKEYRNLVGHRIKLILNNNKKEELVLERKVGKKEVYINNVEYILETAKEKLGINRNKLEHTIHKDERKEIILENQNKYYFRIPLWIC